MLWQLLLSRDWESVYGNSQRNEHIMDSSRLIYNTVSKENHYFSLCNFIKIKDGAIYFNQGFSYPGTSMLILIENCNFYKCFTNFADKSACCYVNNFNGRTVQQNNCFMDSLSPIYSAYYQFASDDNQIKYVTVLNCGNEQISADLIANQEFGSDSFIDYNNNFTSCSSNQNAFAFNNEVTGRVYYCNFFNNTGNNALLRITHEGSEYTNFSHNIIIKNPCDTMIQFNANCLFEFCVFDQNRGSEVYVIRNEYNIIFRNTYFPLVQRRDAVLVENEVDDKNEIVINMSETVCAVLDYDETVLAEQLHPKVLYHLISRFILD